VIKKEKEDSRTQRFLYWFTHQTGYVQSLTHSKDFTKTNDQLIKFTTLAHGKTTLHSQQPLLNLQQTKKPHRVHCVSQEHPCWNLQQVTVIQSPLYNLETSNYNPQQTTTEPTAEQETTQKPTVCFKNSLAETHSKSQLYRTHCITQNRLTLHLAVGEPPIQSHCTTNYTPVIQERSSSFKTDEEHSHSNTNTSIQRFTTVIKKECIRLSLMIKLVKKLS